VVCAACAYHAEPSVRAVSAQRTVSPQKRDCASIYFLEQSSSSEKSEGMAAMDKDESSDRLLLEMRHISKSFPGVHALQDVSFDLKAGEVHALVGENGAGKSTLIKILSGVYTLDSGTILIDGEPVEVRDPAHAKALGVATVYQELNLVPHMTVMENLFLGHLPTRGSLLPFVHWKALRDKTIEVLKYLDVDLRPDVPIKVLGVAQKQMVEIAKAVSAKARIFVFDEPTSALTGKEVDNLFRLIRRLKERGAGVIYISHRLAELKQVADRVTVLRDGKVVGTLDIAQAHRETVTRMMLGREISTQFPRVNVPRGDEVLAVELVTRTGLRGVNLRLRRGEILGLFGLIGSGRTELARAILGADPIERGKIKVKGKEVARLAPGSAVAMGIGYLPEERRTAGLVLGFCVRDNITLASLPAVSRGIVIDHKAEAQVAQKYVSSLAIKTPKLSTPTRALSGGNQQKVVLAKWMCAGSDIVIFDEPTRGIDVGAKVEVYHLMNELLSGGAAILMISSELPEVMGMSDRIAVMREGQIVLEVDAAEADQEKVLCAALGLETPADVEACVVGREN